MRLPAPPPLLLVLLPLLFLLGHAEASSMDLYADLPGAYCGAGPGRDGPNRCCRGRSDTCSEPVSGTICYCDDFCHRNTSSDCCPDYWNVCLGLTPAPTAAPLRQAGCSHQGRTLLAGQSLRDNCNKCECRRLVSDPTQFHLSCESNACLVQPQLIDDVNGAVERLGWRAQNYSSFWSRKLDDGLVLRLGTLQPERFVLAMHPIRQKYNRRDLPESFDGRVQWRGLLQPVRDQGWCGSSWAFSTAAVASDRLAIQSQGKQIYQLSVQNLLACNSRGQQGCNGGHLDRAWNFMKRYGVILEDCYPYVAGESGLPGKCRVPRRGATLQSVGCRLPASSSSSKPRTELFRTPPAYRVAPEEHDIMNEIRARGPVQATMKVRPDFFAYRSGVYRHSRLDGDHSGAYHSVRLIGWGVDDSAPTPAKYWLVANSWGESWGEDGYFRIARGENESDIEKFVLAAWADRRSGADL